MSRVLLAEIKAYCAATGTAKSAFGLVVANDPNLIYQLDRGRAIKPEFAANIRAEMRAHPGGMKRPRQSAAQQARMPRIRQQDEQAPLSFAEADRFRIDAAQGSRELLRAMLRLGLRMGGLPGLDAETFAVRCAAFGLGCGGLGRGGPSKAGAR